MPNKYFNVNKPTQEITITEDEGNFYRLSDGNMIKKDTFMQKYQPVLDVVTESVDTPTIKTGNDTLNPDDFFNVKSVPDDVIQGVKQADPNKGVGEGNARTEVVRKGPGQQTQPTHQPTNEPLVRQIPDGEQVIPNNTNTDVSQYKVYDNDEEAFADFEKKNRGGQPKPQQPTTSDLEQKKNDIEILFDDEKMALGEEEAITRRTKRLLKLPSSNVTTPTEVDGANAEYREPVQKEQPQQLSPIEMMFSTFKRKHPITINVAFEDKIGEPDFVKLMVENMDGDIVGYYKNLVMKNIMKDLSKIEEAVEREIQMEIFGEIKETPKPPAPPKQRQPDGPKLIEGGLTLGGKQKYKYVNDKGETVELLPKSAKTKGYEPYKED